MVADERKGMAVELRRSRFRARTVLALLAVFGAVFACTLPDIRHLLLRSAGWALVASDPEEHADIIVISVDSGAAGALEAAELVRRGISARIAVFAETTAETPDALEQELARRGIPPISMTSITVQTLAALGVNNVEEFPRTVSGTEDEGKALAQWCDRNELRTVIFLSTRDHSRRTRRVLSRSMTNRRTRVLVHYSPYSRFDPDSWWLTRNGVRTELVEAEKLLLDILLHPLSGF